MASLRVGMVLALDRRSVCVMGMPDGVTICRDSRKRIAVRNVTTGRLSYVPEWRLQKAEALIVNHEANEYARVFNRFADEAYRITLPMGLVAVLVGLFERALSPEASKAGGSDAAPTVNEVENINERIELPAPPVSEDTP